MLERLGWKRATDASAIDAPTGRSPPFWVVLAGIVLVGVLVRVAYIVVVLRHAPIFFDSTWYYREAQNLRSGVGYVDILRSFGATAGTGKHPPYATAAWPPGYPVFLAGVQSLFGDGLRISQLGGCVTGAATIMLSGLLGRAVAGRTVGLLGALLVALSPFAIAVDGSLLSETLYVPLVLLALLIAQQIRQRPTALAWSALGAVIGLAALTRADALLMVPLVMIPTAVLSHDRLAHLIPRVMLGLVALVLALTPWVVRNAVRVGEPTIDTVSANATFASANCEKVYGGGLVGWWAFSCREPPSVMLRTNEAAYSDAQRQRGLDYAFAHAERWPLVASARVLRVWGLWNPDQQTRFEGRQSRNVNWQRLAWLTSTATLVLGVLGLVLLRRRRRPIAMLVAPLALSMLAALAAYGNTRFAAAAAPTLAIGAAAATVEWWDPYPNEHEQHTVPQPEDA